MRKGQIVETGRGSRSVRPASAVIPSRTSVRIDHRTLDAGLVALWDERWGGCERLSDASVDPEVLTPWRDDLALLDVIDYGADFRFVSIGDDLMRFARVDWTGWALSDIDHTLRGDVRRILLQACLLHEPAGASVAWVFGTRRRRLVTARLRALPVAGDGFRISQLLLAVFRHDRLV